MRALQRMALGIGMAATLGMPVMALAANPPVDHDLSHYFALGMRDVHLKNLELAAPGCSIGASCPGGPLTNCGSLNARGATIPAPGQTAASLMCGDGTFDQVLRNNAGGACGPRCTNIGLPGSQSDCSDPFAGPILDDLDADGVPSCDDRCNLDLGDMAVACGVTLPLPACDPSNGVDVLPDSDCPGVDAIPGNFRCDLPAGTYGVIRVRSGARLAFAAGKTIACGLTSSRATRITSNGPAQVIIPGKGDVRLNKNGDHGSSCRMLRIVTEYGAIHLGKSADVRVDACSLAGDVYLGHDNTLTGRFVGASVQSDVNNHGECCETTTTTSTTTTTTKSTTTTTKSTTTTTKATTTSTKPTTTTTTKPSTTTTTSYHTTTSTKPTTTTTTKASTTTTKATTTTTKSSTTTTTKPPGHYCTRTAGFYKNHPSTTKSLVDSVGSVSVCGKTLSTVGVNRSDSIIEALCVSPVGDSRLQLVRQLTTAALNIRLGGRPFANFAACNAVCQNDHAYSWDIDRCIQSADDYNSSGDNIVAPFDPAGMADSTPCTQALATSCTVLSPWRCWSH